jgi:hypothetical protein
MFQSPRVQAALTLAALVSLRSEAVAGRNLPDADSREVMSFALTEPGLLEYTRASQNLAPLLLRRPRHGHHGDAPASLGELASRLDASPGVRAAIASAGMTTRQYVVFSWSLLTSAVAAWALDQPGAKPLSGTARANVDFVKKHRSRIRALEVLREFVA